LEFVREDGAVTESGSSPGPPTATVLKILFQNRRSSETVPQHPVPGIYGLFLKAGARLPQVTIAASGLLFVGLSTDLAQRNHFRAKHSGFHSLRRTLGALLKEVLGLSAIPRAAGPSPTNLACYRFTEDGERKLTRWMTDNLEYAVYPHDGDVRVLERELIKAGEPPLNLTGWRNPQKILIQALRRQCKSEAAKAALHQ